MLATGVPVQCVCVCAQYLLIEYSVATWWRLPMTLLVTIVLGQNIAISVANLDKKSTDAFFQIQISTYITRTK